VDPDRHFQATTLEQVLDREVSSVEASCQAPATLVLQEASPQPDPVASCREVEHMVADEGWVLVVSPAEWQPLHPFQALCVEEWEALVASRDKAEHLAKGDVARVMVVASLVVVKAWVAVAAAVAKATGGARMEVDAVVARAEMVARTMSVDLVAAADAVDACLSAEARAADASPLGLHPWVARDLA